MQIEILDVPINYQVAGSGKDIILLHGWGQNIEMMQPLGEFLQQWFRVWIIDLPGGAGQTPEPPFAWSMAEYVEMLAQFIKSNKIENPTLIGHSFGGRMSIIYAGSYPTSVEKLVLLDSAGIKPKRSLDYYAKVYSYKVGKKILSLPGLTKVRDNLTKNSGSSDYAKASPIMKQILSKVVNEDLQKHLPNITVPTLLIWGKDDEATPVADAKIMEKLIPNAGLVILPNAGHYAYLECLPQVKLILASFFNV